MTAGFDPALFQVSVAHSSDRTTIRLMGELDLATVPQLQRVLDELLTVDAPADVVVQAEELIFADVAGIMPLVKAAKALAPRGRLRVCGARRPVVRVVTLLGEDDLLDQDG